MGKPMIMGRKTWESLPGLLPGRPHIVLTRDTDYQAAGADTAHSLEEAIGLAQDSTEIMIIGGANLYAQSLSLAQRLYLTIIDAHFDGDAYFPDVDKSLWQEIHREHHPSDEKNAYEYEFLTLEKKP